MDMKLSLLWAINLNLKGVRQVQKTLADVTKYIRLNHEFSDFSATA
jgi:hypothetical protein